MKQPRTDPEPLCAREIEVTAEWLANQQRHTGEIPWSEDGKMDPWDHVHSAMGLTAVGRYDAARAAFRFMAATQDPNGGWAAERRGGKATRITQESNHAAYFATGLWYLHCRIQDPSFLAEMWPTLERAIDFVVSLQLPSGAFAWAVKGTKVWRAPLLTGSSSMHGSLVCAVRIAERLGYNRPHWREARSRVARCLLHNQAVFSETDLKEKPGRFSMDWYYPVLGGALRGEAGRARLLDAALNAAFMEEGIGCRCVKDKPWYTIAETCELVLALDAVGLAPRAMQVLSWTRRQRTDNGAYWTGMTHPDGVIFPEEEQTTWTASAVLIATDAVHGESSTSAFFQRLAGEEFTDRLKPSRPSYPEIRTTSAAE